MADKKRFRDRAVGIPIIIYIVLAMSLIFPMDAILTRDHHFMVIDSILMALLAGVFMTGAMIGLRTAIQSLANAEMGDAYILALLIVIIGIFAIIAGFWHWRLIGRPNTTETSFVWLVSRWVTMVGLAMFLTVIWTGKGTIEVKGMTKVAVLISAAVFVAVLGFALAVHGN